MSRCAGGGTSNGRRRRPNAAGFGFQCSAAVRGGGFGCSGWVLRFGLVVGQSGCARHTWEEAARERAATSPDGARERHVGVVPAGEQSSMRIDGPAWPAMFREGVGHARKGVSRGRQGVSRGRQGVGRGRQGRGPW
eukprot:2938294-Prymnesium_polylepis.1